MESEEDSRSTFSRFHSFQDFKDFRMKLIQDKLELPKSQSETFHKLPKKVEKVKNFN